MKIKREILILAVAAALIAYVGCSNVNEVAANLLISPEQEAELGQAYVEEIEANDTLYPLYAANDGLVAYIDSIGQAIANLQKVRENVEFVFKIIDKDSVINAFAVPGGFIYVYSGLILNAKNEAELAGVIAHEIGHVVARHGAEAMVRQMGYGYLINLLAGDRELLKTALNVSSGLIFVQYSQKNEFEADSLSVEFLPPNYYNPNGMRDFLQKLKDLHGSDDSPVSRFLSTHPPTQERIDRVSNIIARNNFDTSEELNYTTRFLEHRAVLDY
ncbi:MAG: M48 family metalloprotease [Chitinivibrionales bacterium]|nr:M48 family metalloprotease [Chitinivibrionales bacterium]